MKNKPTIELFLCLILICSAATLSCKSTSSAGMSEKNISTADNSEPIAAASNTKTPIPPAKECPSISTFSPMDLSESSLESYVGCTLKINAKLIEVNPEYVILRDIVGDEQGAHSVYCRGNFASDTYSKIGQKLRDMKSGGYNSTFPETQFTGVVKQIAGSSEDTLGLTDCMMTEYFRK